MPTSILIVTGDAGESYECLYARHRLLEAGLAPVIAAPSRRRLHLVIHDFEEGWDTYVERPGYGADADTTLDDVRVDDHQAVLVLGGRAPEYLRHDPRVLDLVRAFDRQEKWIFGICHGVPTAPRTSQRTSRPADCQSARTLDPRQQISSFEVMASAPRFTSLCEAMGRYRRDLSRHRPRPSTPTA
ncbi:MAG: DJ-1/PfpI family protein [Luteitalea sp.]|nr:DJ-1/PfpI family protein [Luteitalea sp.]